MTIDKTIPVYLIKWDRGSYDDYRVNHLEHVYTSLKQAELKKLQLEESMKPTLFPFECTEEQFKALLYGKKVSTEDEQKYDEWVFNEYERTEFISCWIEVLELYKSE